jgi:hypothetical protein
MRSELKEVKKKIDDEDKARKDATLFVTIISYHFWSDILFFVHPNTKKKKIIEFEKHDGSLWRTGCFSLRFKILHGGLRKGNSIFLFFKFLVMKISWFFILIDQEAPLRHPSPRHFERLTQVSGFLISDLRRLT